MRYKCCARGNDKTSTWYYFKVKGKGHPRTGHEGHKGKKRYSSTLSLISALNGGGWLTPRLGLFTPRVGDPVPLVQEIGWAPGPVWMGGENFAPHRDSIPGGITLR